MCKIELLTGENDAVVPGQSTEIVLPPVTIGEENAARKRAIEGDSRDKAE